MEDTAVQISLSLKHELSTQIKRRRKIPRYKKIIKVEGKYL